MTAPTNAELLFGSDESVVSTYAPALSDSLNHLRDSTGMSEAEASQLLVETSQFFSRAGIQSPAAAGLHSEIVRYLGNPPDDATFQRWETESRQYVRERYPDDGDKRMELAKEYLASFPAFGKQARDSGMGSNRVLIKHLVDRAYHLRPRQK
jgi:hypothetical protein